MNFTNTCVSNMENALRGLRNPLNSWAKSDSKFGITSDLDLDEALEVIDIWCQEANVLPNEEEYDEAWNNYDEWLTKNGVLKNEHNCIEYALLGPKDLNLAQRMIKAGSSDRKFLRQIFVSVDITAPLYWWKEADTYKVGTVANSTSTMHKLSSTPIDLSGFDLDDFNPDLVIHQKEPNAENFVVKDAWVTIIEFCEILRRKYNETKDQRYWKELIRLLPEGWLQTRTWTGNYEILRNMYIQRQHHRLTEWHSFCDWVKTLPYANELILFDI